MLRPTIEWQQQVAAVLKHCIEDGQGILITSNTNLGFVVLGVVAIVEAAADVGGGVGGGGDESEDEASPLT